LFSVAIGLPAQVSNHVTCCNTFNNQVNCSNVQTDYVSPIINAMKATAEAQSRERQLKAQQEQFQQELQLQKEQLKLEQERQRTSEQERQRMSEQQQQLVQLDIDKTLQSLRDRYPDFGLYGSKMAALADRFLPGKTATVYGYIEGLYIIAKHTGEAKPQSDSRAPEPHQD